MRLSRLFILSLTMVVAIAWIGLSVGASFHHHDHGEVHSDCPWCSVANFQLVLTDYIFSPRCNAQPPTSLVLASIPVQTSSDFLRTLSPRAPPIY